MRTLWMGCLIVVTVSGCSGSNPLREPAQGIAAAALTGRGVSLAMAGITGTSTTCVQVTTACTSYPCQGAATVTLGDGCGLPLGGAGTGQITVNGSFSSATDATLQATFVDVRAATSKQAVALSSVTSLSASVAGDLVTVKYVGSNAQARSGLTSTAVGGTSTWEVAIDTQGTPEASDDVLIVESTAAGASAGLGTNAKVASFDNVVLDPSCTENPTAGSGSITEVSGFIPKITKIEFHAACDGKGTVNDKSYDFDYEP